MVKEKGRKLIRPSWLGSVSVHDKQTLEGAALAICVPEGSVFRVCKQALASLVLGARLASDVFRARGITSVLRVVACSIGNVVVNHLSVLSGRLLWTIDMLLLWL